MRIQGPSTGLASVCAPILHSLPAWFGVEAAVVQYVRDIDSLPTWIAQVEDEVVGFLTLKIHNLYAAEILVMGVQPGVHRRGIGRGLVENAERYLQQQEIEYLQVKTLSSSDPDENYARTRRFYFAMGFRPLEELPDLWDAANPCLLMVKRLS